MASVPSAETPTKSEYKQAVAVLRTRLLAVQQALRDSPVPVLVLVAGMEGAGKGEVVNRLNQWLDTRGVAVHAFWDETDEERQRPQAWRYWRVLPAKGRISVVFGGWYNQPLEQRYAGQCDDHELAAMLQAISRFEQMLADDGILLVKFWYRLSADQQRTRLKKLRRDDRSRWKMLPGKGKARFTEHVSMFEHLSRQLMTHTDLSDAPWHVVDAAEPRQRDLTTGQTLLRVVEQRLAEAQPPVATRPDHPLPFAEAAADDPLVLLEQLDLDQHLPRHDYRKALKQLRADLNELTWEAYRQQRSTVLVFEGVDAAGKGGTIRRIAETVDARLRHVIPVAAPSDEELAHHYLWRFWRQIPRAGRMTIFDRSWYGRVLVERVEGLTPAARWQAAYGEIRDFEKQLVDSGTVLLKFWLQISQDEQLARFHERERVPYKRYKITPDDWRNRDHWDDYRVAIGDVLALTHGPQAPWHLVAANDKLHARIDVMTRLRDALAAAL
jgi:polyphosphate:AMP phosphotransferase